MGMEVFNYDCEGQISLFYYITKDTEQKEKSYFLFNRDCFQMMKDIHTGKFDIILTSPFYNTNKKAGKARTLNNTSVKKGQYDYVRYDTYIDNMDNEEYSNFTHRLFDEFDRVLSVNGCVLYNISYGAENTECMFKAVNTILEETNFTIADVIIWKKKTALPNSCSKNRLTRITEFVFVFCRKGEIKTFNCNKRVTSHRKTGQAAYENIYNFIEADNNDGSCPYNKATYSTDLCEKLLKIYGKEGCTVYDPFMGSGTTMIACKKMKMKCYGSEISENQVRYSLKRYFEKFGNLDEVYAEVNGNSVDI